MNKRKSRRLTIAVGLAQTYAWATTYYLPAVIVGPVAEEFGHSRAAIVGGFSWSLLIAGLCAPRVGRLIERHGGRGVLPVGAVVLAGGLILLSFAKGLAGWYAAWTVLGAGMALGLYDAAFATLGRLLGQAARPSIVGVTLMAGFASSIGWPVGAALLDVIGWRYTALLYAALFVVIIMPLYVAFVPSAGPSPVGPERLSDAGASLKARRVFLLLAAFFTLRAIISGTVSVHVLTLLTGLGMTTVGAVTVASLIGPAQVGGRVLDWTLARYLDALRNSQLAAALLPIGVIILILPMPITITATIFTVAYGMSNGILTISRGALPMALFGPRGYAALLGRLAMPVLLAQAAAPTALAPLIDLWPPWAVFALAGALAIAALLCLIPLRLPAEVPNK